MERKSFWITLIVCSLAACGKNVAPGDAQYPVLNKHPQRLLTITLIQDPTVRAVFPVRWEATKLQRANESACTYSGMAGGGPSPVSFHVDDFLIFNNSGSEVHTQFAFDKYEPGLCGYSFTALFYRIDPSSDPLKSRLIQVTDDPNLPETASVDLWCFPVDTSTEDWCDSMRAASIQSPPSKPEQYRIPGLPTPEQAAAAKANGDKEPPALVGPNTRSLVIRVHDARINKL